MRHKLHRRDWLQSTAALASGVWLGTAAASHADSSPHEKLNVAFIGIGGRGGENLEGFRSQSQDFNIVALCDVDQERAGKAYDRFPEAKPYVDFRRMLDEMEQHIDGVVISTPDHTHFHPAMLAMAMGKHVYCEKPLAHSVWEVREMTRFAHQRGVATQLGAQRHALPTVHRVVELIQAGAIGDVTEVYSWVSGARGMPDVPTDQPPVPSHLNWDLWLGPAPTRPYHPVYCPYGWRFWWDFGTGETGNWGCHILDIPFWALGLEYPVRVEGSGPPWDAERTPRSMHTKFDFPATERRAAVTLHWSHAEQGPDILRAWNLRPGGHNTLFVGAKGLLLCGFGQHTLLPADQFADYPVPEPSIPDSPGFYTEWINACKGGAPATCDFAYSGPLAETVLLGNVAYRAGEPFDWDAATLTVRGSEAAAQLIRTPFRAGWEGEALAEPEPANNSQPTTSQSLRRHVG